MPANGRVVMLDVGEGTLFLSRKGGFSVKESDLELSTPLALADSSGSALAELEQNWPGGE